MGKIEMWDFPSTTGERADHSYIGTVLILLIDHICSDVKPTMYLSCSSWQTGLVLAYYVSSTLVPGLHLLDIAHNTTCFKVWEDITICYLQQGLWVNHKWYIITLDEPQGLAKGLRSHLEQFEHRNERLLATLRILFPWQAKKFFSFLPYLSSGLDKTKFENW